MQVKYIIVTALLVAVVALVCGCSGTATPTATPTPAAASQYPMTVSDYFNRNATIASEPQHIISLSAANTEMLFDLGVGGRIVGVDDYSDYPAAALNITHVSGFNSVSYEKITAANPDLIVAEDIVGEEAVTRLRSMGFPVVELKNSNLSLIKSNIALLGKITNTEKNATTMVNNLNSGIAGISAKTAGLNDSQKPNVLLVTGYLTGLEIYPYGTGTYGDELLTLAGGRNAAKNISLYAVMSNEAIVQADPDYIVIPVDGVMCTMSDFNYFKNGTDPWMKSLTAVKNGKVVMVDGNLFLRPGPRSPEAGLALARAIHPELFQ